ncbi:hypothetical protein [Amycolatopsis sp. cmx-8-4]|uniref:hypothetical protein n=1 Tax=Amycolatopsis sp. cmx-8-4 TaxID=2790947 RepID=UPI00397BCF2E
MTNATGSRGRIDKREAILTAAFAVFARLGYDPAGVQEIAAEIVQFLEWLRTGTGTPALVRG